MNKLSISAANAEYQIIQSLKQNRLKRNKLREVFVEGIECIKQAVNSNKEITRIIIKDFDTLSNWGKDVINKYKGAKVIEMSANLYNELADKTDPSEMLITVRIKLNSLDDMYAENPFLIVFDRPGDFGNLGSMIRSANVFNADGLFIMGHGVDVYDPKVIRASLGSVFFSKIVTVESIETLEGYIKKQKMLNDMEVIGTDSTGTVPADEYEIKKPVMLILGNEAKGMSVKLKDLCDKIIRIPMKGNVNSLNVSCAASIIMWEIFKNSDKLPNDVSHS